MVTAGPTQSIDPFYTHHSLPAQVSCFRIAHMLQERKDSSCYDNVKVNHWLGISVFNREKQKK